MLRVLLISMLLFNIGCGNTHQPMTAEMLHFVDSVTDRRNAEVDSLLSLECYQKFDSLVTIAVDSLRNQTLRDIEHNSNLLK